MFVPFALAELNGDLGGGNKYVFAGVLTSDIKCPTKVKVARISCLVVDGHVRMVALGKPSVLKTWLIIVVECTLQIEQHFDRIDISLDRYTCVGQKVSKGNHTETVQEFGANA